MNIYIDGANHVGKKAVYNRMMYDQFVEKGGYFDAACDPTARHTITVDKRQEVYELVVSDSSQPELRELAVQKWVQGFILIYSVEMQSSLEKLAEIVQFITQHKGNGNFPFVVVANKTDLPHQVSRQDGVEFAQRHGVPFIEISCRNNTGLAEVLPAIVREIRKKMPANFPQAKEKERCMIC